jgi:hypothetical protein
LTLTMFTTSSLQLLALTRQHVVGDLLARYCNPVSVRTEGYVSNWQRGSVQDLLKLVAVECVFAHCAILGPGYEEAALRPRQYFLCRLKLLDLHQLRRLCCLLGNCPQ